MNYQKLICRDLLSIQNRVEIEFVTIFQ